MCLDTYIHIFEGLLQGGWENLQTSFSSGQHVTPAANSGTRNLMTKSTTPMTLCSLQNNEVHIQFSNSVHSNCWNTLCLSPDIMIWNWSYGAAEVTRRGHWKSTWLMCQQTNDKWQEDKWQMTSRKMTNDQQTNEKYTQTIHWYYTYVYSNTA